MSSSDDALNSGPTDPSARPPSDPWHTSAPILPYGGGEVVPPPPDREPIEPAVPDDTAGPGSAGAWATPPGPGGPRPAGSGARRWATWLPTLLVLAAIAGFIALAPSERRGRHPGGDGSPTSAATTAVPAVQPPVTTAPSEVSVTYEVAATGRRNVGSVEYVDAAGDIIRHDGVSLPWRLSLRMTGPRPPLVLITQRREGGDSGAVTCSITVADKVVSTATRTGRFAAPQCSS